MTESAFSDSGLPGFRFTPFRAATSFPSLIYVAPRKVWDYSDAIGDPSLFADRLHLNAEGARRLAATMAADGLFAAAAVASNEFPPPLGATPGS